MQRSNVSCEITVLFSACCYWEVSKVVFFYGRGVLLIIGIQTKMDFVATNKAKLYGLFC